MSTATIVVLHESDLFFDAIAFSVAHATFGINRIKQVHPTCIERTNDGRTLDTDALCAFDVMRYWCGIGASIGATNIIVPLLQRWQEGR